MNTATLQMSTWDAKEAYRRFKRDLAHREMTDEDHVILMGYRALARGHGVIDVAQEIGRAGLDTRNRPKLAIARADWKLCWCYVNPREARAEFKKERSVYPRARKQKITIRAKWTYYEPGQPLSLRAVVPYIPPSIRPSGHLDKYHILWEAEWEQMPIDPLLLRHLSGTVYAVLAGWNLTPLERMVMAGTRQGN
jgi:hypothetical protein